MIGVVQQLSDPVYGIAACLGFFFGTAARTTAHLGHLGRKHR